MSQQPRQTGSGKDGWITLFSLVSSIAANLVTILSGFSGNSKVPLFGAILAALLGVVVLIREHGKPFTFKVAVAFGSAVAGFILGILFLFVSPLLNLPDRATPSPSSSPDVVSTPSHLFPSVTVDAPTPAPPRRSAPTPVFDGEVRLEGETGVDAETGQKNGQMEGVYSRGLTGPLDLYLNESGILQASGGGVYPYGGLEGNAYESCLKFKDSGRPPGLALPIGNLQFCFVTSGNRVAWARVGASSLTGFPSSEKYAVMRVKVWEN